jgi:zinc/manganese transport system substrate-binding protein
VPLSRRIFVLAGASAIAASATPFRGIAAVTTVPVTATFSILGDMVQAIGGKRVTVTTLVGSDGDPHVYEPRPEDARAVTQAAALFLNGMGFEGWLDRLVDSSDFRGGLVIVSQGVEPLVIGNGRGVKDPHAWHDLANAKIYATNIAAGLITSDPDGRSYYEKAHDAYIKEINAVEREVKKRLGSLPPSHRRAVISHDSFGYFGRAYGIEFLAPQGLSTEAEPSANDLATLIRQIREENVRALFLENASDPRLIEQIQRETGVRIGGTLYSDALSGPDGPAPTYLAMMRHNIRTLATALA